MIVLDTHVLIWLVSNPEKLSKKAKKLIDNEIKKRPLLVSSISVWEIFMLMQKRRLILTLDSNTWMEKVEQLPFLQFVPIDNTIASKSVILPNLIHQDPADRMIIATARENGATLITSDKKILLYRNVKSVW